MRKNTPIATSANIKACLPFLKSCIKNGTPLKIELGAGEKREGWISIDQYGDVDIVCNIVNVGIPFPDNSVDIVYSQHFFENLSYPNPMTCVLFECKRVLKKDAIFSICVPDARIFINAYLNNDSEAFKDMKLYEPGFHYNSPLDYINYIAYMGGHHKHMFDIKNLIAILENAGFITVRERPFDKNLDNEMRRPLSIYAECSAPNNVQ